MIRVNDAERKRGRPAGKNRQPFSAEQRRARNAELERERRAEQAAAYAELAAAAGCEPGASTTTVMATAINIIIRLSMEPDIGALAKDVTRLKGVVALTKKRLKELPDSSNEEQKEPDAVEPRKRKKLKFCDDDDAIRNTDDDFE